MCYILAENKEQVNSEIISGNERFRLRDKLSISKQMMLYKYAKADQKETSKQLARLCQLEISISQTNRIRKEYGVSRKVGRPKKEKTGDIESDNDAQIIGYKSQAGVGLLSIWIEEQHRHDPLLLKLYKIIENYKCRYPKERFRLLKSKEETIVKKWKALMILPLLGIGKLSELDYKPHKMVEVIGYSYGSSTLTQFLGELERVGAQALKGELAYSVVGEYCYIDSHMMAFWSRVKMHKGLITMNGRIMPGSKAVIGHDVSGNAISLDYYPPDTHLNNIIEEYCASIEAVVGIKRFIIDREVNSVNIANLFVSRGWELICLLNANEYKGLDSFNKRFAGTLEDGTIFYKATWEQYKEDDCRKFVVVQEQERNIVYWSTPKLAEELTAKEIVVLYRNRTEIQENNIKRMIAHGALNINYGIKKIIGEDRTHQRKVNKVETSIIKLETKQSKLSQAISIQHNKIEDSECHKHHKLLEKRKTKLERLTSQQKLLEQKSIDLKQEKQNLGLPCQRADRDHRKQTIMSFRTLWMENIIKAFFSLIFTALKTPVDIEIALELFCFRSATIEEQHEQIVYYFDTKTLSVKYQNILKEIIVGFNRISLSCKGKTVVAKIIGFT